MGSLDRTLVVVGPSDVGKTTIEVSMLFKYGGIDMVTMQTLEASVDSYVQVPEKMKALHITPIFDTPRRHHVTILAKADCTIFVVAPDTLLQADQHQVLYNALSNAKKLIILVNKMDAFGWSEEQFKKAVIGLCTYLESNGIDVAKIPIIPISAIHGDNLVELSPKCSWYQGWEKEFYGESKSGTTLLEALDISFKV